jgi:hypothetical protein
MKQARRYFLGTVLREYQRFVREYPGPQLATFGDPAYAKELAVALLHQADYTYRDALVAPKLQHFPKLKDYRKSLWERCNEYEIVCDCADAFKHSRLDRKDRTLTSMHQIEEVVAMVRYEDELGSYNEGRKLLVVTLDDGQKREISSLFEIAVEMWCHELLNLSLIETRPSLPTLPSWFRTREEVAAREKFVITGRAGEELRLQFVLAIVRKGTNTVQICYPGGDRATMPQPNR